MRCSRIAPLLHSAVISAILLVSPAAGAEKPRAAAPASGPQVLRVYMSGSYLPLHGLAGQERIGIEAEIAEALAASLGKRLEYVDRERTKTSSLEAVALGRADVALNAITPTKERAERVDFTEVIAQVPLRLARFTRRIDSLKELAGRKIAVPKGPVETQLAGLNARIVPHDSLAKAVESAKGLHAYAVAAEEPALVDAIPARWMILSSVEAGRSPIAMAVPKGRKAEYDAALAGISDRLERIREKWGHYWTGFRGVSVGRRTGCAVTDSGELACFGEQEHLLTPPAGRFVGLSMGAEHACALREDLTVACWGRNDHGQADPKPGRFTRVTSGVDHTCGLRQDGTIACWGANRHGQTNAPAGSYRTVGVGDGFSCALGADGRIACWGRPFAEIPSGSFRALSVGPKGACGLGTEKNARTVCWTAGRTAPVKTSFIISHMSLGFDLVCGIEDRAFTPHCFGTQIGYVPDTDFLQVEAGEGVACGVRTSGALECWGRVPSDLQQVRAAGGAAWKVGRASASRSPFLVAFCSGEKPQPMGLIHPERGLLSLRDGRHDRSLEPEWYVCSPDGRAKRYTGVCGEGGELIATVPLAQKRTTLRTRSLGGGETSEELEACDLIGLPGSLWTWRYSYDPEKADIDWEEVKAHEGMDVGTGALRACSGLVLTWRGSPDRDTLYLDDECPAPD